MTKSLCLVRFCLLLTLCSASSGFSCRWISSKFRQYHGKALTLLREMGSGVSVESRDPNIFSADWIIHHTSSQPQKQVWLVVQTLEEISFLLREADTVTWSEEHLLSFLSMLDHETEGLRSCVPVRLRNNKRLSSYFNQLRGLTHIRTDDQIVVWEQIRKELLRVLSLLELLPALSANYSD